MKRGQRVMLYWDGKQGRGTSGVITGTSLGHHITVRFIPWGSALGDGTAQETESRFRVLRGRLQPNKRRHCGWSTDIKTGESHGWYLIKRAQS